MKYPQTNVIAYTGSYHRSMTDEQCRILHCASLEIMERTRLRRRREPGPLPAVPRGVGVAYGS